MKRRIKNWELAERIHDELLEAVNEEEWSTVISLANLLLRRTLSYGLKKQGVSERRVLRLLLKHLPKLSLSKDYTRLFDEIVEMYKNEVYFEDDEEEFDIDVLKRVAGECSDFFHEIRAMAVAAGDAT